MTDYRPVDCGLHSEFELAVLRRQPVRISWQSKDGQAHIEVLTPVDLLTRQHEEYLVLADENRQQHALRLDHILKMENL